MTKQPSYRFADYDEHWAEKKLGDIGSVEMCRRIFKEETSAEFEIPFFKIGTFGGEADTYITREKFEEYKAKFAYPQRGDLLLSASGSIGRVVEYDGDEAYYQDSNIVWLNHHGKINNKFLKAFYEIVSWSGIEGTTIKRLYNKNILETDISLPSLPEQTAIGSFFQDIDQLISLQQRKLEVLKEQKKTYLKLLFPAKGQTKPALCFAGFEDEWTSVLLGDISELYQPKTISSEELLTEGFPVFGANGYIGYYKDYNHKEDQVTISARGEGTGTPSFVEGPVWITGNSMVVNVEKQANIIKPFLYAFCLSFNFKPFVTGGAQPQLTREVLKKVNIMLPSLPEQEAIGAFFQDLDKAIAKQEEKVNQLKESKQTLLRKMFI